MRRLVVVLVGMAAFATTGCGGDERPPLPEGRFIASHGTIAPEVQLFAEPVTLKVDVIVDRDRFDPERIRITGDLTPYERIGEVARSRRDLGGFTHLGFQLAFRCLAHECVPKVGGGPPAIQPGGLPPPTESQGDGFGERKTIRLAATRVVYDDPNGKTRIVDDVDWRPLQAVSRLNFGSTYVTGIAFPFEASVTPLPAVSYRISPGVLATGSLLGALILLAFPAVLLARHLRADEPAVEPAEPELTPLERALALVEWSRDRSVDERRESLELLASTLDELSHPLADRARRLAWPPAHPEPEAIEALVRDVKESDGSAV